MKDFFYFIILLLLYTNLYSKNLKQNSKNSEDKLLFVLEHFRHGARGPYSGINRRTYIDFIGEKWDGFGELTPLGLRMLYLLGVSTRKKYSNFLSKTYNPYELFILSTDFNRTLDSANSFLQGLYNNKTSINLTKTQIDRSNILNSNYSEKIQIKIKELENNSLQGGINLIPVHIVDTSTLEYGLYEVNNCPGIEKYKNKNKNRQEVINIYEDLIRHTNDTFGEQIFKFMNISNNPYYLWDKNKTNILYLTGTFISDYFDGREMNYIKNSGIDMESFYNNSLNVSFIDNYYSDFGIPSTETVIIGVTSMFKNMFTYMDKRIELDKKNKTDEITSNSPRFMIASAHDASLAPIDIFMKTEFDIDLNEATFASNRNYELWKNGTTGGYSIHYLVNLEEKAVFDYDIFKKTVLPKLFTPEQIKNICYP